MGVPTPQGVPSRYATSSMPLYNLPWDRRKLVMGIDRTSVIPPLCIYCTANCILRSSHILPQDSPDVNNGGISERPPSRLDAPLKRTSTSATAFSFRPSPTNGILDSPCTAGRRAHCDTNTVSIKVGGQLACG